MALKLNEEINRWRPHPRLGELCPCGDLNTRFSTERAFESQQSLMLLSHVLGRSRSTLARNVA